MSIKIAPSILSADFGRLADELQAAEQGGADWIHLDVMDGHFVPNITIGPLVAAAARKATRLPLDAHLMISDPDRYIRPFVDAGVDSITVHAEVTPHLHRTVQEIRNAGARAGVAINPGTSQELIREIIPFVDLVLVMSVNPGFGGQKFIEASLGKVRRVRALLEESGRGDADLQVDGGVTTANIRQLREAGATVVVAGFAVYNQEATVAENVARLKTAASPA
ncbi:MAG: ribulose-phosphate 3-epimerase [Gemmatimonadota bacterium]|jgi:ribulose-phosphate 3-epimerase|nr:ribulose-phosphate 3-epimerase [Gemmatimonadota bacterium]